LLCLLDGSVTPLINSTFYTCWLELAENWKHTLAGNVTHDRRVENRNRQFFPATQLINYAKHEFDGLKAQNSRAAY